MYDIDVPWHYRGDEYKAYVDGFVAAKSMQSEPPKMTETTPDQASMLADIFVETDAFYKIEISLEPVSRDVTLVFHNMDEPDFNDLLEFGGGFRTPVKAAREC